jgi:hypothetical protein
MHHQSTWGPRPEREPDDEVHILGKKIESFWPFLDGLILSMANYLGFIIPPYAFAFHTGRVTTSVMEDDSEFDNNYFARRNVQTVAENIYRMIKLVKKQAWKVFQEFTHPLSEDEVCGIFDLKKEMQRFEDNDFFRKYNQDKGLI